MKKLVFTLGEKKWYDYVAKVRKEMSINKPTFKKMLNSLHAHKAKTGYATDTTWDFTNGEFTTFPLSYDDETAREMRSMGITLADTLKIRNTYATVNYSEEIDCIKILFVAYRDSTYSQTIELEFLITDNLNIHLEYINEGKDWDFNSVEEAVRFVDSIMGWELDKMKKSDDGWELICEGKESFGNEVARQKIWAKEVGHHTLTVCECIFDDGHSTYRTDIFDRNTDEWAGETVAYSFEDAKQTVESLYNDYHRKSTRKMKKSLEPTGYILWAEGWSDHVRFNTLEDAIVWLGEDIEEAISSQKNDASAIYFAERHNIPMKGRSIDACYETAKQLITEAHESIRREISEGCELFELGDDELYIDTSVGSLGVDFGFLGNMVFEEVFDKSAFVSKMKKDHGYPDTIEIGEYTLKPNNEEYPPEEMGYITYYYVDEEVYVNIFSPYLDSDDDVWSAYVEVNGKEEEFSGSRNLDGDFKQRVLDAIFAGLIEDSDDMTENGEDIFRED